jgi:hypothetical protein
MANGLQLASKALTCSWDLPSNMVEPMKERDTEVNNSALIVATPPRYLQAAYLLTSLKHNFVQQEEPIKMKVTIKEWNAVATWRWDMPEDDVCGICRVQFDGTCPTCKFPGDDCSLCEFFLPYVGDGDLRLTDNYYPAVLGKCGHSFHMVRLWIFLFPFIL